MLLHKVVLFFLVVVAKDIFLQILLCMKKSSEPLAFNSIACKGTENRLKSKKNILLSNIQSKEYSHVPVYWNWQMKTLPWQSKSH